MSGIKARSLGLYPDQQYAQHAADLIADGGMLQRSIRNILETCVPEGIRGGKEEAVIAELVQLYNLAGNR